MQNEQLQQVIKALKEANNVLVTVKTSPSVDELSAAVGLTLALNKADKHATTVFSGNVPSTIEFLQPEQVIETNTDSLRDFIIALDKSKADKLRYKVEDSVVRIFITPYRTSISEKDLEFSQGDFNVDVVIALGVVSKEDFDAAVTAHGRILHDATVIGITKQEVVSTVGSLNWQEPRASSVSEMISAVVDGMDSQLVDGQMATAFLTGIVSETDRFKNEKTTPEVLAVGSRLMSAGANQQLIAEKLDEPLKTEPLTKIASHDPNHDDGALEIEHDDDEVGRIHIDDNGNLGEASADVESLAEGVDTFGEDVQASQDIPIEDDKLSSREYIPTPLSVNNAATPPTTVRPASEVEQPSMTLPPPPAASPDAVVNAQQSPEEPQSTPVDAMPEPATEAQMPMMQHGQKVLQPLSEEFQPKKVDNPVSAIQPGSLADLEQKVESPHAAENSLDEHLGSVRSQVNTDAQQQPEPQQTVPPEEVAPVTSAKPQPLMTRSEEGQNTDSNGPPAVPPPLMPPSQPQFFDEDGKTSNPFVSN
jgi:hypothetical protein